MWSDAHFQIPLISSWLDSGVGKMTKFAGAAAVDITLR